MSDAALCPRCRMQLSSPLALCPGCLLAGDEAEPRIGNLVLGDELGRGGMGTVFRARDVRLGREVAVKFLAPELAAQPEIRGRFEREARALAQLNHPNIVTLHDAGDSEGELYLTMELIEGPSLASRLPLPGPEAVGVVLQVCAGLGYAHARGIVHRDIKPANVLVDASGRAKVADFGIARSLQPGLADPVTRSGAAPGTPAYQAPEARAGAPADPRMDVFGVGVLLYELVTGRVPVGDFAPLPGTLDRVVRRALAEDPARRFQSMEELAAALRGLEHSADTLPPEEQLWLRAVGAVQAAAVAMCLWAGLTAVTPRVAPAGTIDPLVVAATEQLADGRIVSRARFETGPILAALIVLALAAAATGLLRAHWRRAGLDRPDPERPVRTSAWVLGTGVACWFLYLLRRALEPTHPRVALYTPVLGGLLELSVLLLVCISLLEASRRARPARRETALWLGLGLAVIPPVIELFRYLDRWHP